MLKNCPVCQGTKKTRQLGMMSADCVVCDATGKVDSAKVIELASAANPITHESLPENFYKIHKDAEKVRLKSANFGYMNKTKAPDGSEEKLSDIGKSKKSPLPPPEDVLVELRKEIKPRDAESMTTQSVELSPAMKAQLKSLEPKQESKKNGKGKKVAAKG